MLYLSLYADGSLTAYQQRHQPHKMLMPMHARLTHFLTESGKEHDTLKVT